MTLKNSCHSILITKMKYIIVVLVLVLSCGPITQQKSAEGPKPYWKSAEQLFKENQHNSIEYIIIPPKDPIRVKIWIGEGTNTYYRNSDGQDITLVMPHHCLIQWPNGRVSWSYSNVTNGYRRVNDD